MSETTPKNAIVVGVDGSTGSDAAIQWAADEATLRAAPIILVHVVAPLVVAWPVGRIQGNITQWMYDQSSAVRRPGRCGDRRRTIVGRALRRAALQMHIDINGSVTQGGSEP
ncbi:MAG: universal stress protein [Mycobacterium sp.]|nr:universal stress protein [Mycobacterium sp.]